MNRRLFLRYLGLGSAVAASAPATLFAGNPGRAADAILHGPRIGEYADYCDLSSAAFPLVGKWVSYDFHYTTKLPVT